MSRSKAVLLKCNASKSFCHDSAYFTPTGRRLVDLQSRKAMDLFPTPELSDVYLVEDANTRKLVFKFEGSSSEAETREAFTRLVAQMLDELSLIDSQE